MQTLFSNWTKVLAGMVTMTFCLILLGVVFAPMLKLPVEESTRQFVFMVVYGIVVAVGLGNNTVTRTLGIKE